MANEAAPREAGADGLVIGRECGSCTLCCKVFDIPWLDKPKPAGKWCSHCKPGAGCSIWETIPQKCGEFYCLWRKEAQLGDDWRPDKAGFVIGHESANLPFSVKVDPGRADAWRKEPYITGLRNAAASAIAHQNVVVVIVGTRQWILLPDGDVPVPIGLENTDFRIYQETPLLGGNWKVRFLAQTTST